MRILQQPGPVAAQRRSEASGALRVLDYDLAPGQTLLAAITTPLLAAGMRAGSVLFGGVRLDPFRYWRPGPADGAGHAAWYSVPEPPLSGAHIIAANATFGWRDDAPFLHCHAVWRMQDATPDSAPMGGHILPDQTFLAAPARVRAYATADATIIATPDAETNFTLFQPHGPGAPGRLILARLHPNQDITLAMEELCAARGIRNAILRGSIGSLVGARFTDGRVVEDYATEVLVRHGSIRDGRCTLDMSVVDIAGNAHTGVLVRGENAVCITAEMALEAID
ncbi:MAG: DUF296 domain-containing protein [Rhodospirillales bacterium]|nr:DUF296 domain-containing protein [Rhodospirillales bacterium]